MFKVEKRVGDIIKTQISGGTDFVDCRKEPSLVIHRNLLSREEMAR